MLGQRSKSPLQGGRGNLRLKPHHEKIKNYTFCLAAFVGYCHKNVEGTATQHKE